MMIILKMVQLRLFGIIFILWSIDWNILWFILTYFHKNDFKQKSDSNVYMAVFLISLLKISDIIFYNSSIDS